MTHPTYPVRQKQPGEKRTLAFEFGPKIAVGDSLTGTPVMSSDAGLTFGPPVISGTRVSVQISGGTDGNDYAVQCKVDTVGGDILQIDVLIEIREKAN